MGELTIGKLKDYFQVNLLRDGFAAVFGPITIVLLVFSAEQLFEYFHPYVSPNEIDGIVYLWLHTISLFFILGFGGVVLLRSLSVIRKSVRILWNMSTPPFSTSADKSTSKISPSIVEKAKIISIAGLSIGAYLAFLLQIIGFVPYRQGMILTGPLGRSAPNVTVPRAISEMPIINDLVILGDFIASPHTLGYVMISISVAPIVVGFWNLTYLFFNYRKIEDQNPNAIKQDRILFRWMPYVGLLEFVIITWMFGAFWFLH
ncbi:hypothetical protein [Haloarcula amylolytica]|uniref:hypothetical protein n=1 Tax=Haloarcula amylolytica TaxID=396317 RepID=UPI0012675F69|nr:hypothetical protein [Haloarcula amylolytica]